MPTRLKKLIGSLLIVVLAILYALVATTIATYRLAELPWWIHLIYFLVSGLIWIIPAMFIIRWMYRPRRNRH